MPISQNRYLYCVNDPIGYYDRSGNRVDEDAGKPKKVTPSTSAKKVVATPKTPTPTPTPKTTPLPKPAPSPDTKFNANTAAKKSSNTFAKILIGAITVVACIGIIAVSGGLGTPVAAMALSTVFASSVATGITLSYGNNLIQQIDQTKSFKEASDNAAKTTTKELPYIVGVSLLTMGAGAYAGGVKSGALPSLGLKQTAFATSAFDDVIDDTSGAYAGQQATGAAQSGSAGTTACTSEQIAGEWHHIASDKSLVSGYTEQYDKIFRNAGMSLQDDANLMFLQNHSGAHTTAYKEYVLNTLTEATEGLSGNAAKDALIAALDKLKAQLLANPLMPYKGGLN